MALQNVEQRESITTAFLVLLETLSPQERAVFLLYEVFEYAHAEIADLLGLHAANCRQLFHRAQMRLAERRRRFEPAREAQQRLMARFLHACQQGDIAALTATLAEDVVAVRTPYMASVQRIPWHRCTITALGHRTIAKI